MVVYHVGIELGVRLQGHPGCPGVSHWARRDGQTGKVVRLYYRDPATRKWLAVGYICLTCGAAELSLKPALRPQ